MRPQPSLHAISVEIEAPDGAAALALEQRLAHLAPTTVARGRRWVVEVPGATSAEELGVVVREWLDEIGEPATTMLVDGRLFRVAGHEAERRARHRASHGDFIG